MEDKYYMFQDYSSGRRAESLRIQRRTDPSSPAFGPLMIDGWESIPGLPPAQSLPSGTTLLDQGKRPVSVCLIEEGLVKLVYLSAGGGETILGLRSRGWLAGVVQALNQTVSPCAVQAVTPCRVRIIPSSDQLIRFRRDLDFNAYLSQVLSREAAAQMEMQAQLRSSSSEERLERFLSESPPFQYGIRSVELRSLFKQTEVAQLLSMTPEHLSRLLKARKRRCPSPFEDRPDYRERSAVA